MAGTYMRMRFRFGPVQPELETTSSWTAPSSLARPQWRPAADLFETAAAFFVKLELAGLGEDDVRVGVHGSTLVVEGARPWECEAVERFHVIEIPYGPFRIEVELPPGLEPALIQARFDRGFLTIRLPKAEVRS